MPREISAARARQIVEAATAVFIERGYRRTQMLDVAKQAGVAKGTLYGYVQSKEAMLDWALREADRSGEPMSTEALPWPTPSPGQMIGYLQERLTSAMQDAVLVQAEFARSLDH